ncbi:hypothetical protein VPH35_014539 [Triticum aestivum]|uniref:Uncharacterized protein n=1 Tax=Aegilops tauschii subsp. strangulata TaxID=200361 RepID=A0A452YNJ3_AEGTS
MFVQLGNHEVFMSNGTQAFFKYMLLQAPRFRSTPLYSCVGLPFSSHLIYGLGLLSRLFNTKYIIRIARFLFVFVSEAAKNLVVATTAAPSVRALRAPITNTSYGSGMYHMAACLSSTHEL